MKTAILAMNEEVQQAGAFVRPLFAEMGKVVIGQSYLVERLAKFDSNSTERRPG